MKPLSKLLNTLPIVGLMIFFPSLLQLNDSQVHSALLQPQTCVTPPPGMVSWWPGDGNAIDIIGGNHGALHNGAAFAAGMVGQAFSFDGVDDHVTIPSSATLNGVTSAVSIDLWFNANSQAANQILASRVPGVPNGWQLDYTANGGMNFWIGTDGTWAQVYTLPPSANAWHHVVGTWDGSMIRLYVDGMEVGSAPKTGVISASDAEMAIGNYNGVKEFPFGGLINEVEIYNRALSQSEIQAIFNAGSAGKCKLVTICHKPGAPAQKTLVLPAQALAGHLGHGDTIGACG